MPMTGAAFVIFTLYMIPDPVTSPIGWKSQVAYGAAIPIVYAFLIANHLVFGPLIALVIVCGVRGLYLHFADWQSRRAPVAPPAVQSVA